MKKVIGLCLAVSLCSTTLFAENEFQGNRNNENRASRCEKIIRELKLNDKQAAEFREIHQEFSEKMREEREDIKKDRREARGKILEMREERNVKMKKVLTQEQYRQYLVIMDKRIQQNRR